MIDMCLLHAILFDFSQKLYSFYDIKDRNEIWIG